MTKPTSIERKIFEILSLDATSQLYLLKHDEAEEAIRNIHRVSEEIANAIKALIKRKFPKEEQTQATNNGAWYLTEWDEGWNACLADIIKIVEGL